MFTHARKLAWPLFYGMSSVLYAQVDSQTQAAPPTLQFVENRVLVKFKNVGPDTAMPSADALGVLGTVNGTVVRTIGDLGVQVVETTLPVQQAIEKLTQSGSVEYAEPDYIVHTAATIPSDPFFGNLWGLNNIGQFGGTPDADIDAPEAWDVSTDSSETIVGVVDTGVDYTHSDLADNMWTNPHEIAGNGIDDDANGFIDDVYGADFCSGTNCADSIPGRDGNPMDEMTGTYHGTHVGGTIGAKGDNNLGVVGVAWKAKIMALRFLDAGGSGSISDAAAAVNYALNIMAANGYKRMVLNNSWGGGGYSQTLYDAINRAKKKNVLFIAAAGNNYQNNDINLFYPAAYDLDNVIVVGATNFNDAKPGFSNWGCSGVDLSAPGENIYSTKRGNAYQYLSGTSMATPHVAGMSALVWSLHSGEKWQAVKSALMNSADPNTALAGMSVVQGRANLPLAISAGAFDEPTVWNVNPRSAKPGKKIAISGYNFGATPGGVTVNGVPATVVNWGASTIKAKLGVGTPAGMGKVQVIRADANIGEVGACFTVN